MYGGSDEPTGIPPLERRVVESARAAQATPPGVAGNITFQRYLGPDNSQGSIYTIDPAGSGEHQVTNSPPGLTDRFPDFSPHSERIAFQRCGDTCHVMSVKADGTDLRSLTQMCPPGVFPRIWGDADPETGQPAHVQIWFMQSSGQAPRAVTHPQSRVFEDDEPQWTPDGKRIVFTRVDTARGLGALHTVRSNGHDLRQITPYDLDAGDGADISPDGKRVLFRFPAHSGFAHDGIAGLPDVWTMKTDGTDVQRVPRANCGTAGPTGARGNRITTGMRRAIVASSRYLRDRARPRPVAASSRSAPCPGRVARAGPAGRSRPR